MDQETIYKMIDAPTDVTPMILVFTVGGLLLLSIFIWQSWRQKRVTPLLSMSVAMMGLSWLEAPYDWAMWFVYNPAMPKMPAWGPLAMTWGGLPWTNILGYVVYHGLAIALAAFIANHISKRWGFNRIVMLLVVGFVIGAAADLYGTHATIRAGLGRYARGLEWLTINGGTPYNYSYDEVFSIASLVMMWTYLAGRGMNKFDLTLMEAWAQKVARTPLGRAFANLGASIALGNITFAALFIPEWISAIYNLKTVVYSGPLFHGLPPQPGPLPDPSDALLGVIVVIGGTLVVVAGFIGLIFWKDPLARRRT